MPVGKSGRSSHRKGSRGEIEVRDLIRAHGFQARRGGVGNSDDVVHAIPGWHFEIKREETPHLAAYGRQLERDRGDRMGAIVWRQNRMSWKAVLDFDDLLQLLEEKRDALQALSDAREALSRDRGEGPA